MKQAEAGKLLWTPSRERIESAGITDFIQWANEHYSLDLKNYQDLWQWSINDIGQFWEAIWKKYQIEASTDYTPPLANATMPGSQWFTGAKLNIAEYLLKQGELADPARTAVFADSECFDNKTINWIDLRDQVAQLATCLRESGIKPGDRVAAYMPISIESVVETISGIKDSLIINLELPDAESFMPMFVVLADQSELDQTMLQAIRKNLAVNCSPRHVPDKVYVIHEVPYTLSGKKQEIPVKKLLSGTPLKKALNPGACANPKAMDYFIDLATRIKKEYTWPATGSETATNRPSQS